MRHQHQLFCVSAWRKVNRESTSSLETGSAPPSSSGTTTSAWSVIPHVPVLNKCLCGAFLDKGESNAAGAAAGGGWIGTGDYCIAAGGSGSGGNQASAAKAKVFFQQWEEDKGLTLGKC